MWHFRNDEKPFHYNKFRSKSTFHSRNKDTIIETYLTCLEERLLDIDISSKRFNNLTREERNALHNLRDDPTIIKEGPYIGSAVVVWDKEDYLREAYKQLENKDVYEEVQYGSSILVKTIMGALEKIRIRGDHPMIHLITSWSKILNLLGFILYLRFPNIGKPVISN